MESGELRENETKLNERETWDTGKKESEVHGLEPLLDKPHHTTEDILRQNEIAKDTTCGIGCIRGRWLQKFANEKIYALLFGILGCLYGAYFSYFNGIITTMEKRFKIPSKTMGVIATGSDMVHIFVSPLLSYYTGKGHRPRWVGLGIYIVVLACILSALPHFLFGAGRNILEYTLEHETSDEQFDFSHNRTLLEGHTKKQMCNSDSNTTNCQAEEEGIVPTLILFLTQIITGLGDCLYLTVGTTYMDDNIKKSKTPALISFSFVLRMLGPSFGYWLSSLCLKLFVVPTLTPTIKDSDPRWIGAWWLGNFIIGLLLFFIATLMILFPKILPQAAARKKLEQEAENTAPKVGVNSATMNDMISAFKRLLTNPVFNYNNLAATFHVLWAMAYWIFLPKYMETQYRMSASFANFFTGTSTLIFSTVGVMIAGAVLTKFRPRARLLAGWNVIIGLITAACMVTFIFIGCAENDNQSVSMAMRFSSKHNQTCLKDCNCDYVMYSPVCSELKETYVSPCHAGCKNSVESNGTNIFTDCECIVADNQNEAEKGKAFDGACEVDCHTNFKIFLALICLVTFMASTGRPSNFLIQIRCVEERDKSIALGFGMMFLSAFAFIPSPILFGHILDTTCVIWGKTCEATGNCWLYDSKQLRYVMNLSAASFVTISTILDLCVWYYVKDIKLFDEKD